MYCKVFTLGTMSLIVTAGASVVTVLGLDKIPTTLHEKQDRQLYLPFSQWPMMAIPRSAAGIDEAQQQLNVVSDETTRPQATAQRPITVLMPLMTPLARFLDQDASLRFLPKPASMPTSIPHFPVDMAAHLHSAIAANIAKIGDGSQISALHPGLFSQISSLSQAEKSAGASITSLRHALETEEHNFKSASVSLATKIQELKHIKNHDNKKGTAASLTPSWSLVLLLTAAIAFAGLAFIL